MDRRSTGWTSVGFAACFAAAVYLAFRAITPREASLWDLLVRPPIGAAYLDPISWWGWIYAVPAKRAIGLFRLSEFSLRLPALVAGACYLALLPRRPLFVIAGIAPVALGIFSTANGLGLSLALCAAAVRWPRAASVLLGIAVAASPVIAIPLVLAALWKGIEAIERIAIPALVTAFILLILPLSRAAWPQSPPVGSREVDAARTALLPWRGRAVRVKAVPGLLPVVRFYKDRYRERGWTVSSF